jgi:Protein of unknown function (DUF3574)
MRAEAAATGSWVRPRGVRTSLAVAILGVLLSGCAAGPARTLSPPGQLPVGETLTRSELLFGRSRPDGRTVTDTEWAAFVDEEVTPRFPDGLTILDATGQYRDRSGRIVQEATKILLIVHPADPRSRAALEEIRALYRKRFDQESVLLLSSPARVSF